MHIGADSARAAITFSFFSIFSWVSSAAGELGTAVLERVVQGLPDHIALMPLAPCLSRAY